MSERDLKTILIEICVHLEDRMHFDETAYRLSLELRKKLEKL